MTLGLTSVQHQQQQRQITTAAVVGVTAATVVALKQCAILLWGAQSVDVGARTGMTCFYECLDG